MTTLLSDQSQRRQFCQQTDQNFSVIAPAGVGKTTAIVERIVQIARQDLLDQYDRLERLVVVTYTNKAAQQMRERAEHALRQEAQAALLLQRLRRAFFGTIHSFCLKLLRQHGHALGITPDVDLLKDSETDWIRFLSKCKYLNPDGHEKMDRVLRYVDVDDIFKLAKLLKPSIALPISPPEPPSLDLRELLHFRPSSSRSADTISHAQTLARRWLEREKENRPFNPIPSCKQGGQAFLQLWQESFAPLGEWIEAAATHLAAQVSRQYRSHRMATGRLTYDDQIELAAQLLAHPETSKRIRQESYSVILDEAQDTDPDQFRVLLEIARPSNATGNWLERPDQPLRAGAFSMVGDPQQLIYSSRSDLEFYNHVRKRLVRDGANEIYFHVTFRCSRSMIDALNQWGPRLLNGERNQPAYVNLQPRPNADAGQVLRWKVPPLVDSFSTRTDSINRNDDAILRQQRNPSPECSDLLDGRRISCNIESAHQSIDGVSSKPNLEALAWHEAQNLAQWLKIQDLQGLQARDWNQAALLAPRRQWLEPLRRALQEQGLRAQIHSSRKTWADSPFYRWLMAAMTIVEQPCNSFEIIGVLREIFGLSDESLAQFAQKENASFQIAQLSKIDNLISQKLQLLTNLRNEILALPLREGVELLVQKLHLIQRLQHIGEIKGEPQEWESILIQASQAEAKGASWTQFTQNVRNQAQTQEPETAPQAGHLQLLTHHKAKGLEWDAVILPFFYRPIIQRSDSYPQIVRQVCGQVPHIMMESATRARRQEELDLRALQERQRLLYVALTRARHTLILVDDLDLFGLKGPDSKIKTYTPQASDRSFGYLLPPLQ